ncbi:formylglycine-generating enzyme family protein [Treponema sp. R80B11-R83G3]
MKNTRKWQFITRMAVIAITMFALARPVTAQNFPAIDIKEIGGVTAPVVGAKPVTEVTPTLQYRGTVTWSPNHAVFEAATTYTATITLTARTGYTLQEVTANFFTVAGARATNAANSGVVTAIFQTAGMRKIGIEMIRIPGGTFQMGEELAGTEDVTPVHAVTLSAFSMSKYLVTQEQYEAVMGMNPSYFSSNPASGEAQRKRPVESVTWYDAVEFCNKLSAVEELQTVYTITNRKPSAGYPITDANVTADFSKNGYRLPTEAQWEYAAKGGNPNAAGWKGYTYSGSNNVGDVAWYYDNSGGRTHEVGKKAPNSLGLYDMSGNVYEWCWDWYGDYSSGAQTDPTGVSSGDSRVIRGGGWGRSAEDVRSSCRTYNSLGGRSYFLGFRLVRP